MNLVKEVLQFRALIVQKLVQIEFILRVIWVRLLDAVFGVVLKALCFNNASSSFQDRVSGPV